MASNILTEAKLRILRESAAQAKDSDPFKLWAEAKLGTGHRRITYQGIIDGAWLSMGALVDFQDTERARAAQIALLVRAGDLRGALRKNLLQSLIVSDEDLEAVTGPARIAETNNPIKLWAEKQLQTDLTADRYQAIIEGVWLSCDALREFAEVPEARSAVFAIILRAAELRDAAQSC